MEKKLLFVVLIAICGLLETLARIFLDNLPKSQFIDIGIYCGILALIYGKDK